MEFFRIVNASVNESDLVAKLSLEHLERFTNLLFNLEHPKSKRSAIGGLWGEFTLERSLIKGGLRFALRECPNALCWTITTGFPPKRDAVVIHLTINRERKAEEFLLEIEEFLDDLSQGLTTYLKN